MLKLLRGGKQDLVCPEIRSKYPARAELGHRLTLARELMGLTHQGAARRCSTGVSADWIRSLETALADASLSDLNALANAYDVSVDWLLGRVPELADLAELGPQGPMMSKEVQFRMRVLIASCREAGCAEVAHA